MVSLSSVYAEVTRPMYQVISGDKIKIPTDLNNIDINYSGIYGAQNSSLVKVLCWPSPAHPRPSRSGVQIQGNFNSRSTRSAPKTEEEQS